MKFIHILCLTVAPICASIVGCSAEFDGGASSSSVTNNQALKETWSVQLEGKARAKVAIEAVVPTWSNDLLRSPTPGGEAPPFDRPREMASAVSDASFSFVETRRNGRSVFRSADRQETVKGDSRRGYWKYIAAMPALEAPVAVSSEIRDQALSRTHQLFASFKLPEDEIGKVVETDVGGDTSESKAEVVAHHVELSRQVNGLRVSESRVFATYARDGTLFRAEVRWPEFRIAAASLRTREEALEEISDALATRFGGAEQPGRVESELTYELVGGEADGDGTMAPVLTVWVFPSQGWGMPDRIQYSLVSGVVEAETLR